MNTENKKGTFFSGNGSARACLRAKDWGATPLGLPSQWPQALHTVLSLILNSKFPMFVAWGPQLLLLYNDEYIPLLGDKHPSCLGCPMDKVWAEIWPEIGPIVDTVMAGRAVYYEDLPLIVQRHGFPEHAWFTFSYSPLEDQDGTVTGLHCVVAETTKQVEVKRGQAFQLMLSDRLRPLRSADDVVLTASESLGLELDVSRVLYAECDASGRTFYIRRDWNRAGMQSMAGVTRLLDDFGPAVVAALRTGQLVIIDDIDTDPRTAPYASAFRAINVRAKLAVPLVKNGALIAILALHDNVPRRWSANEIGIASDMAERTWSAVESAGAQAELRDANQRKDEFLAMLAHELRNPLAPISAAAELMEKGVLEPDLLRLTSQVIGRQVRHMTGLVDDLLDVSRVTRGQVTIQRAPQDMKQIVASAIEQVRPIMQARNHHLALELGCDAAWVMGDQNRLVQVLANILNNAAKYTPDGGHIALRMETSAEQVIVSVEDDGIGIAPELQSRVFELFAQAERSSDRSQGGLGLGLALVKSLVGLHEGDVSCSSAGPHLGSRFVVRLPRLAMAAPEPGLHELERIAAAAGRHRVMIVDDNADAATMLGMLMEACGHEVLVQYESMGALATARTSPPSVCILDIGLPDMDGYELARRLRELEGMDRALLIAVTGYGQDDDRKKALGAGFDHHMVKPVDANRLLRIVSERGAITS